MQKESRLHQLKWHFIFLVIVPVVFIVTMLIIVLWVAFNIKDILSFTATVLSIYYAIVIYIKSTKDKKQYDARQIYDFTKLHNIMTDEMKRIVESKNYEEGHLYIISFTPAFGNISTPQLYENYSNLLDRIAREKRNVDIKIICLDEKKRCEYHEKWAAVKFATDVERRKNTDDWEKQALDIIESIRRKRSYNSVIEVGHIHPVLFFSTNKMLIQYAIKLPSENETVSKVMGTILPQGDGKDFFNHAFKEYSDVYLPVGIAELYEGYFKEFDGNSYITAADKVKRALDGKTVKNQSIGDVNILLAYGGGKDSTMSLIFLKYVQSLFLKDTNKTFKLHILTHIHPGMRKTVFENIKIVFNKLRLYDDKDVHITFQTKNALFNQEDVNRFFRSNNGITIPRNVKEEFRREMLLFGHLSKGLGRYTFCYTCNIDMIMSIITNVLKPDNNIHFIVTGDSKEEKGLYTTWLNEIFSFVEGKEVDIRQGDTASFCKHFVDLQKTFNEKYLGILNQSAGKITIMPELFDITEYVNFSLDKLIKEFLEIKMGFKFESDSFNFSETDCFYPAIMAYTASLRGGLNKDEHIKRHLEHVKKIMREKGFHSEFIDKASNVGIKYSEVKPFLEHEIGISDKQIKTLVESPFLDDGKNLQSFLNRNIQTFNASDIIGFIRGTSYDVSKKDDIETFIREWVGLECRDIITIMKYSEDSNEKTELLEKIARYDPYNDYNCIINGVKTVISGR